MATSLNCWNCGQSLAVIPRPISRHANCPSCYAELHCCRLCRHFDLNRPGQCDDERADPPVKKDTANFCDWFTPKALGDRARGNQDSTARSKLNALFGNSTDNQSPDHNTEEPEEPQASPEKSRAEKAREELEKLFGKK